MKLGAGKAGITPPVGAPLAGFGFRDHGSESILDELEVRAFWFEEDGNPDAAACIVTADIIGFDAIFTGILKDDLYRIYKLPSERVLLCASHTHSGPQTCANMIGVGELVQDTLTSVRNGVIHAVAQAQAKSRSVQAHFGRGMCGGYAINRRIVIDGKASSGPNPAGVRDDEVSVIYFTDAANGAIVSVLFHFTCHPTTMGSYSISAEYPGFARRQIESALGNGVAAGFLPGCFGDVRPDCTLIGGTKFRRGQPEDIAEFGGALAEAVLGCLRPDAPPAPLPASGLYGASTAVGLVSSRMPSKDELMLASHGEPPAVRTWANRLLEGNPTPTHILNIQRLDIGAGITLLAMGGEVCCDYGRYIKTMKDGRNVLPLGYTNGIVGYIPSARMFAEGGYEVEESTIHFGLPSAFTPDIEPEIKNALNNLLAY